MSEITIDPDFSHLGAGVERELRKYRGRRGRKRIRARNLERETIDTVNDEVNLFHSDEVEGSVVLGVYGLEDWIRSSLIQERHLNNENTIQLDGTWLTPAQFNLVSFAKEHFSQYTFFSANNFIGTPDDGSLVKVLYGRGKIEVEVTGDAENAAKWFALFDSNFRKAENLIRWVYNSRGDDISVPLNYRPAIRAAYPWIDPSYETLGEYLDEYMNSSANVLILIGPPGTGKTTFIKNLIHRSKADAKVAYDPKVMMEDGFFAGFVEDESQFLIMEDADEFLQSRTDGNSMMHKFLNVSDGLISAADKKLVFSTNLPNVNSIDEALMRPGRCFDVLQFRALTREEAQATLDEIGSTAVLPDEKQKFTLAEVFGTSPSGKGFTRRKFGFTG